MKILLACVYFHSSFGWSIEQALRRQGHSVRVFEYRRPPISGLPGFGRFWSKKIMPGNLLAAVRNYRPDLLFIAKGETIPAETLVSARRETGCRIINWFPDSRIFAYENVLDQIRYLDLIFSKNPRDLDRIKLLGAPNGRFLQHCADRELHIDYRATASSLVPYQSQVALVGSYYPYRDQLLSQLVEFDLRVWGSGWERSTLFRKKPSAAVLKEARSFEQASVFRSAVVNLNLHHFDDTICLNQRIFDIAGSGGCQLLDAGHNVESVYEIPSEVETFGSLAELLEKMRFLLNHPETAREMGIRAQKKTAASHTYDHRIAEIFGYLGD